MGRGELMGEAWEQIAPLLRIFGVHRYSRGIYV
jgi:hypothetical protein